MHGLRPVAATLTERAAGTSRADPARPIASGGAAGQTNPASGQATAHVPSYEGKNSSLPMSMQR